MELSKLSDPFPLEDVEWRVSRAGIGPNGLFCRVFAYITARAIQHRLDDVCGPESWQLTQPHQLQLDRKAALSVGISIKTGDEWVTKWDDAELTDSNDHIPPFKGGFSGAMKRAGAQWGIGRYLYHLKEVFADVTATPPENARRWNYAKIKTDEGTKVYHWRSPDLPGWALPKEPEAECSKAAVVQLVADIRAKLCPDVKDPKARQEAITRFVYAITGDFPIADHRHWTRDAYDKVLTRLQATTDPNGPSADVPFGDKES